MIVGARMDASVETSMTIGWYAETFARTKRMKPLAKLLEAPLPPSKKAAAGANKVAAMFRQAKQKQADPER